MAAQRSPDIGEKVRFLSNPHSYPHRPSAVEVKETHMSWVFLAGGLVYKLKKPVSYPFLDFTSLESRRWNCREEVRLNARLAEGVYLRTIPLCVTGTGELSLEPTGQAVDWLVCMRRLPASRMLDELIAAGAVTRGEAGRAAAKLVAFYAASPRLAVSPGWVEARFSAEHAEDSRVLTDGRFDLDTARTHETLGLMHRMISRMRPLIARRAAANVYVEGHGDLRPEHVCLIPDPVFIDCLEFNRDLRVLDPFDEVAYLALECQRLGASWIGDLFLEVARRRLSPPAPAALINFYRAARALLRARLALAHLLEPHPRTPEKWEPRARAYITLAHQALEAIESSGGPER